MFAKKRNEIVLSKANLLGFQLAWRSIVYVWGTDKINLIHMTLTCVDKDSEFTTKQFTIETVVAYRYVVTEVEIKIELLRNRDGKWVVSDNQEMIFPSRRILSKYRVRPSFYALNTEKDLGHRGYDSSGSSFASGRKDDKLPWIREELLKG
ncbi:MAG: hypothetical protein COV91_00520 [Candidatus Taylorbacteria bacterium CG11_big_fil_rev_8_21_14_0_20_46_11]|uniref:Uncharacterized protein n=1 Tax=Candidatus Taylorbacteria bacterium CG11_big_fil_rev_8_21_14_0_20_46_11 TaxID=1975025 RepID=A0A2H0KCZ7_9BACT|nr:MAG: hypothetical protein COV91_00520 [Candidatus Taylorbacteria bacterium CG11_big_fil_rev_8_21_14_0_20_46_11]